MGQNVGFNIRTGGPCIKEEAATPPYHELYAIKFSAEVSSSCCLLQLFHPTSCSAAASDIYWGRRQERYANMWPGFAWCLCYQLFGWIDQHVSKFSLCY
jgi:hypothetical protein